VAHRRYTIGAPVMPKTDVQLVAYRSIMSHDTIRVFILIKIYVHIINILILLQINLYIIINLNFEHILGVGKYWQDRRESSC
jgi:hypothetical protein